MGNIKTSFVKKIGKQIYEQYKDEFTEDFSKNKDFIKKIMSIRSKKLRNTIAGYVTNLKKQDSNA